MTSIALSRGDVVIGVDTHKDEHVAVALDGLGGCLFDFPLAADPGGYAELLAWADALGAAWAFGSRAPVPTAAVWPGSCAARNARSSR
jgi:hypothetical protein